MRAKELGASADADRATHEQSPQAVSAVPVGIPSAEWRDGADLSGFKWPLGAYAPGGYMGKCHGCGDTIVNVDKRALLCLACSMEAIRENRLALERALRIRIWNEAKGRGISDRAAMQEVEEGILKATSLTTSAPAQSTQAYPHTGNSGNDGTENPVSTLPS